MATHFAGNRHPVTDEITFQIIEAKPKRRMVKGGVYADFFEKLQPGQAAVVPSDDVEKIVTALRKWIKENDKPLKAWASQYVGGGMGHVGVLKK